MDLLTNKEEKLLLKYVINNEQNFIDMDKKLYSHIEDSSNRKNIASLIYLLAKSNKNFLNEIFDNELHNELKIELDEYEYL